MEGRHGVPVERGRGGPVLAGGGGHGGPSGGRRAGTAAVSAACMAAVSAPCTSTPARPRQQRVRRASQLGLPGGPSSTRTSPYRTVGPVNTVRFNTWSRTGVASSATTGGRPARGPIPAGPAGTAGGTTAAGGRGTASPGGRATTTTATSIRIAPATMATTAMTPFLTRAATRSVSAGRRAADPAGGRQRAGDPAGAEPSADAVRLLHAGRGGVPARRLRQRHASGRTRRGGRPAEPQRPPADDAGVVRHGPVPRGGDGGPRGGRLGTESPIGPRVYRFYGNVEPYTEQLRALEKFVQDNPKAAEGRFLLGLQYMIAGHSRTRPRTSSSWP